jgi:protein TonB
LNNPLPVYPPLSKRLGEQGQVLVKVLISAQGYAQQAAIAQSSGFKRLDEAALNAVHSWRFVPGKRGGVPEAMWFNVPVEFGLKQSGR